MSTKKPATRHRPLSRSGRNPSTGETIDVLKRSKRKAGKVQKKCKAESMADKCLLYEARHSLKRAAKGHASNIKKRGGKYKMSYDALKDETVLQYSFPKNR
jgi:hypothetical protein